VFPSTSGSPAGIGASSESEADSLSSCEASLIEGGWGEVPLYMMVPVSERTLLPSSSEGHSPTVEED
jgi:hypothetical protein